MDPNPTYSYPELIPFLNAYWDAQRVIGVMAIIVILYQLVKWVRGGMSHVSWIPLAIGFSVMLDLGFEYMDTKYYLWLELMYDMGFSAIIIWGLTKSRLVKWAISIVAIGLIAYFTNDPNYIRLWCSTTLLVIAWSLIIKSLVTERIILYDVAFKSLIAVICIFDLFTGLYWNDRLLIDSDVWRYIKAFTFIPLGAIRLLFIYYYGIRSIRN